LTSVGRLIPLCTGLHRYDKSLSVRGCARGQVIAAPIVAYLIETTHGRILYDVGCDYAKIAEPRLRARHYGAASFPFGPPEMDSDERLPLLLARLGLRPDDVDAVVLGHLHFDHAGGLADFPRAEIHCHPDELAAARQNADGAYFIDEIAVTEQWRLEPGERALCAGVRWLDSPGHTAGHRSLLVELPDQRPVLLAGDAADLQENLDREVAPGILWHEREDLALASIRRLKQVARQESAELWPNHDLAHWQSLQARAWPVVTIPLRAAQSSP
jgi:N-acyl homoserine lactone hydrolase